jgi:hypothetical protein
MLMCCAKDYVREVSFPSRFIQLGQAPISVRKRFHSAFSLTIGLLVAVRDIDASHNGC